MKVANERSKWWHQWQQVKWIMLSIEDRNSNEIKWYQLKLTKWIMKSNKKAAKTKWIMVSSEGSKIIEINWYYLLKIASKIK